MNRSDAHWRRAMWHARRGNVRSAGLHAQRAAHSRFGAGELVADLDAGNGRDIRNLSGNVTLVFQGRQIPCSLAVRDGEVKLVVEGATDECLNVSLCEPAYVSSISTLNNECPANGPIRKGACPLHTRRPTEPISPGARVKMMPSKRSVFL